jgi:hypothetical protein
VAGRELVRARRSGKPLSVAYIAPTTIGGLIKTADDLMYSVKSGGSPFWAISVSFVINYLTGPVEKDYPDTI